MAKVVRYDGRTFLQPRWQDQAENKAWPTAVRDNLRERTDQQATRLQMRADELTKVLNRQ